ncbi:MAG: pseudouridine-5'-phosphate glycosidase, partial [Candidatus Cloacimonadales bacterium]
PILVLESTIITHGMPFPQNYETAKSLENLCRSNGVTPATIAIYKGKIHIGLDDNILTELSALKDHTEKVSTRDIGYCLALNKSGGTTVAATSFIADLVGLEIFATGGIGGVHRGVIDSWDISADMQSLKSNHVLVICAGAKAILDIPKTLELLDSYSVPVFAYKSDDFPAFYSSKSGNIVKRVDTPVEIARIWQRQKSLGLTSGMLIGNPISTELEIPAESIEEQIQIGLKEVKELSIKGKDITPFLLQRLYELTSGDSLTTNINLVKNNVKLGCKISKEMSKL